MDWLMRVLLWADVELLLARVPRGVPFAVRVLITPEIASMLLRRAEEFGRVNYRNLQPRRVERYGNVMSAQMWFCNGETLKLDSDVCVFDGQHRLHAIIRSGVPMETFVVFNLDLKEDSGEVRINNGIDEGKGRVLGDSLKNAGVSNPDAVAAMLRKVALYRKGGIKGLFKGLDLTSGEILRICAGEYKAAEAYAKLATRTRTVAVPSIVAAVTYIGAKGEMPIPDYVTLFVQALTSGLNLSDDDPVYVLRQRLMKSNASVKKLPLEQRLALTIMAWNKWLMFESCRKLAWNPRRQELPDIQTKNQLVAELWASAVDEVA